MKSVITRDEEKFLNEHFRYFTEDHRDEPVYERLNAESLLSRDGTEKALNHLHIYLESESFLTTGSFLGKRFGYYAITVPIVLMTLFDKFPDVSPANVEYVRIDENPKWFPKYYLKDKTTISPEENRKAWIEENMRQLFRDHLAPIFFHIHKTTRVSKKVLWENVAIYLYWLYERKLPEWYEGAELERLREDFRFIVEELDGEPFGEKKNPFTYFESQPVLPTGARERKCCCLSYRLHEDSTFCKVCPHLKRMDELKNL
ncbi:IucA/IucC family C-terminal-domain containing protein [Salimicrobium halophilum]|uniref:Ferric iron reductase protein FhuF, involved in iron transport n=1 Tax=Salimicrobium halophilum TaxID=86666 RepID=A0A1G8VC63_9BACI|nr:IucA/IucC family C-terminal-domain containing protein [Salimicrobium halophilum]SDJ63494.1 Ferric iron reductase protein FhuF, involved in iron transport [Salimicrobium halophilum]